jgi:DNA topoisomerase-1
MMAKQLVIVESPAKAKTINRYLGGGYLVKASMGHIRDLPKKKLGIDIEHDFLPEYHIIPEREPLVKELQKAAKDAESVLLAADPDREGEAICWHLSQILEEYNSNIFRVLTHEITKNAIEEAFKDLDSLDQDKINAQQTRRLLDRLVGYLISPLLWEKVGRGLSAGRVQSIALRLICEREKEIRDFKPEEYWTISAHLEASELPSFKANLSKIDGKKVKVEDEKSASSIVDELWDLPFTLKKIQVKNKKKNPPPPYITSTLQQDGFRLLRFPVRKTMSVAQKLYEGLEIGERGLTGLITYMRTDSVRVSDEAVQASRDFIKGNFPPEYLMSSPRNYKNKRKAQDAHEAIRPTSFDLPPDAVKPYLKKEEFDLYRLVWNRFVATQMSSALVEETEFQIEASRYLFVVKGEVLQFDGYLALYPQTKKEESVLPKAKEGETLKLLDVESKQNFTQPPPRYTEGSLVKELEAKGIGRPSTYAPIISTLQGRVYVFKEKGKFIPSDLGLFVTDYLIKNFPDLMDFEFTARLEGELDLISEGQKEWLGCLKSYHALLDKDLQEAMKGESIKKDGIPVEESCPECGKPLVIKEGRYGRFRACSGYPECRFKEPLVKKEVKPLDETCPECGAQLVMRRGKYGTFAACSNYPKCKYIKKEKKDTGIACPLECKGTLIRRKTRKGKIFWGCSDFPKCKFASWDEPIPQPCPECGRHFVLKKSTLKGKSNFYCSDEKCGYKEIITDGEG